MILRGGERIEYENNMLIKIPKKELKANDKIFDTNGSVIDAKILRSKTNKVDKSVTLVFDQNNGHFKNID